MRHLNAAEFDERIYDEEEAALIFFHRKNCRVCRAVSGILAKLEEHYPKILFGEVDAEAEMDLFSRFGLLGVPQVLLFADGNLIRTIAGEKEISVYEEALNHLSEIDD